jgi:hypothetical protein
MKELMAYTTSNLPEAQISDHPDIAELSRATIALEVYLRQAKNADVVARRSLENR